MDRQNKFDILTALSTSTQRDTAPQEGRFLKDCLLTPRQMYVFRIHRGEKELGKILSVRMFNLFLPNDKTFSREFISS